MSKSGDFVCGSKSKENMASTQKKTNIHIDFTKLFESNKKFLQYSTMCLATLWASEQYVKRTQRVNRQSIIAVTTIEDYGMHWPQKTTMEDWQEKTISEQNQTVSHSLTDLEGLSQFLPMALLCSQSSLKGVLDRMAHVIQRTWRSTWSWRCVSITAQNLFQRTREDFWVSQNKNPAGICNTQ